MAARISGCSLARKPLNGNFVDIATVSGPGARPRCSDTRTAGGLCRSPSTLPDAASSTSAASATVRASTPLTVMPLKASGSGQVEMRPRCGLMPTRCVQAAGMRTLPAPSEPIAAVTRSGGHRGGAAARRAARRVFAGPRVAGVAEGRAAGERPLTEFAGVGLADDDRTRGPQPAHHLGVRGGGQRLGPTCRIWSASPRRPRRP